MPGYNQIDALSSIQLLPQYDKSVEALDLPNFTGTQSVFNPYVIFALYDTGKTGNGPYDYTSHYDIVPQTISPATTSLHVPNSMGSKPSPNPLSSVFGNDTNILTNRHASKSINTTNQNNNSLALPGNAQDQRLKITPTAANIIEYNRNIQTVYGYGPTPYSWSDFLYCKYYGKIPNNYLVTLRRYPFPVNDNVTVPNQYAAVPVAQAVTYMGEQTGNKLSDLLKMTYGVKWKEVQAAVQEVPGNERAFGAGIESFTGNKAVSAMGAALTVARGSYDQWSGQKEKAIEWSKKAYTNEGPYWNQIYGPVNVVDSSHMRDRGLKFQHEITLSFEYELKSYSGINPKVAMLDLITNFLVLTYTNAKFWGGATRYFPNASFRVGFLGDQKKFYGGDYTGYAQGLGKNIVDTVGNLASSLGKALAGDLSSIVDSIGKLGLGNMAEKSMPNMLSIRSMLSGEPVGEWHLTVGNPLNPIAVIGNLIMTDATISFGETLGVDDFPTEVKFEVKLKPGKPRDKGDIESMFNNGYGRMTYAPMTALPSSKNTFEKGNSADELYAKLSGQASGNDNWSNDNAVKTIQTRVRQQWGHTFGDSANLLFMINSTKSRF